MNARYLDAERSQVERLNDLLGRNDADPGEVRATIESLSDVELTAFGLNAYRMNLVSLFGARWPRERIERVAREAAISKIWLGWEYYHHYLPRLGAAPEPAQLRGFPADRIRELLALGRGLVMVSFHQGHMRHLPSDMVHAGIGMCLPLARDSFNDYHSAQQANPDAAIWAGFKYVNVEERGGALVLARTLAKRGCVFALIDGNTGIDGPRGEDRRETVRMLDSTVRVKNGLIALAARFGSPVLPIIAHEADGQRVCRVAPAIDPGGPLDGEDAQRFVAAATAQAYAFLADDLSSFAGQWCGGDLFHRWRIPDAPIHGADDEVEQRMRRDLGTGARVTLDERRIVELLGEGDLVWTDALTQRCYKFPAAMRELAERLTNGYGVDQRWLDGKADAQRATIWRFIGHLAARGALRSHEAAV